MPLSDPITVRNQARAFANSHARELASELIQWQDTGLLIDGRMRELAAIWSAVDASNSLSLAENTATRAALDALVTQLGSEPSAPEASTAQGIEDTLRRLRLHGVIPLYVGSRDCESLEQEIANASPELIGALDQVWLLESAPISRDIRSIVKAAANNGLSRW